MTCGLVAGVVALIWSLFVAPGQYAASVTIVTSGELTRDADPLSGVMQALPFGLTAEVRSEAQLCRNILETQAVRIAVVEECELAGVLRARSSQDAAERLRSRTRVSVRRPSIVALTLTLPGRRGARLGPECDEAAEASELVVEVLNAYLKALSQRLSDLHLTAATRRRVFVEQQKHQLSQELIEAEERLQYWEAEHGIIEVDTVGRLATEALMNLEQAQDQARVELRAAAQQVASLSSQLERQPEMETASVVRQANPLVMKMREKLIELETERAVATQAEGNSQQHPKVRAIEQEITSVQQALAEEQERAMLTATATQIANPAARQLEQELIAWQVNKDTIEARISGLEAAIGRAKESVVELSDEALEYGRLLRTMKIKEALFETLASEYEQALIEEQATEPVFYVIDEPVVPERPEGPGPVVKTALAGVVGALVGWIWVMGTTGREKRRSETGEWKE